MNKTSCCKGHRKPNGTGPSPYCFTVRGTPEAERLTVIHREWDGDEGK